MSAIPQQPIINYLSETVLNGLDQLIDQLKEIDTDDLGTLARLMIVVDGLEQARDTAIHAVAQLEMMQDSALMMEFN